jgi:hypothetical protein
MNLMAMTLTAGCRKHHHCVRQAHGVSLPEDHETAFEFSQARALVPPPPAVQRKEPVAV